MPRIIRSSGVNIERARSIVVVTPAKEGKREVDEVLASAAENRQIEMEKIKASADLIVEEIIGKARNDADNILVDARQETINVLQDALREGWDQGMNEALKQVKALQEAAQREIDEAMESMTGERRRMINGLERDVLELVFDIADKVLSIEMDRSDKWIEAMVREAMRRLEGDESVVLKVANGAREKVAALSVRMLEAAGKKPSGISVVADAKLPRGGCVIETEKGAVNNSVEDKADRLKSILREST